MKFPSFLKKKRTYAIAIAILLIGAWVNAGRNQKITYETVNVEKRDLQQTVEVTGELKPAARLDLSYDRSAKVKAISKKVGDQVKAGDVILELENNDVAFALRNARAALSVAAANLNQRAAGATTQSVQIAQAGLDKAQADLDATKRTVQDNLKSAQLAVDTAKSKLDNQSNTLAQNTKNTLDNLRNALLASLGPLRTALVDGDTVSGVDDTISASLYANVLGINDSTSVSRAKLSYQSSKPLVATAETAAKTLNVASTEAELLAASDKVVTAILSVQGYLGDVQKVLAASIAGGNLSASTLAGMKSSVDADRVSISSQNAAVASASQAVKNLALTNADTVQQLKDAYQNALVNFSVAETKTISDVALAQAAWNSAKANLENVRAPARAVDLAPLRAAVEQAQASYEKALTDEQALHVKAPIDGTVSEIIPGVGEQISPSAPIARMVGTQTYDIEALVPESDISKVAVNQAATVTLDAFGDDVKFNGTVTTKEPAETKVQEAVYYKIRVQVDPAGRDVKPGMTANVTVLADERKDVLVIPLRAVKTIDGKKTVRVLVNEQPQEREIVLGLRGDEGRIEVTEGLKEGEKVIVGETK